MTFISKRHRNVFPRWKTTCTCFFFNFFFVNSNGILRFQMYNYYQYFTLTLAISDKKTKDIQHTIKDVWYDFHVSNMYFLWQDISFYIIIWPRAVWTTLCKKKCRHHFLHTQSMNLLSYRFISTRSFISYLIFDLVILNVRFDSKLKTLTKMSGFFFFFFCYQSVYRLVVLCCNGILFHNQTLLSYLPL